MAKKNELNLEELDKVTGGTVSGITKYFVLGPQISVYDTEKPEYLNKEIYVEAPQFGKCRTFAGTLLDSWEGAQRTIKIKCKYGYRAGETFDYGLYVGSAEMTARVYLIQYYK